MKPVVSIVKSSHNQHSCMQCGSNSKLSVDHIIPKSRQGSVKHPSNLQILCTECNGKKGNRVIHKFWWVLDIDRMDMNFPNRNMICCLLRSFVGATVDDSDILIRSHDIKAAQAYIRIYGFDLNLRQLLVKIPRHTAMSYVRTANVNYQLPKQVIMKYIETKISMSKDNAYSTIE